MRCLHTLHCLTGFLSATLTSRPWKQNGATMRCLHTLHCLTGFLLATLTSRPWKQNSATVRCLHTLHCPTGFLSATLTSPPWKQNGATMRCLHTLHCLTGFLSATLTSPPWKQNGATMRCLHTLHCLTGFLLATLTSLPWKQNGATMRCLHAQYCPAGFLSAARLLHPENRMVQQWDACTCSTALLVLCQLHWLLCPKSKMLWQPNVCVWQLSLASVSTGFLCPDFLLLHMGCWLSAHSSDFPSIRTKCYTTEKRVLCSITLLVLSQLHWFPFPKNLPPMRSLYVTCNTTLLVVHRWCQLHQYQFPKNVTPMRSLYVTLPWKCYTNEKLVCNMRHYLTGFMPTPLISIA